MELENNKGTVELKLIGRLKFLGYLLIGLSVVALLWPLLPEFEDEEIEEELLLELPQPLNPFMVSGAFAIVGISCILISWRKRIEQENSLS